MIGSNGMKRSVYVAIVAGQRIFVLSESVNGNYKLVHDKGLLNIAGGVNRYVGIEGFISLKDTAAVEPPEHIPENVEKIFREGRHAYPLDATSAAGTMFRLCIDIVKREMLPEGDVEGLNARARRDLGLRLPWLFDHGNLPEACESYRLVCAKTVTTVPMQEPSTQEDAEDLLDFTIMLLERSILSQKDQNLQKPEEKNGVAPKVGGCSEHRGGSE